MSKLKERWMKKLLNVNLNLGTKKMKSRNEISSADSILRCRDFPNHIANDSMKFALDITQTTEIDQKREFCSFVESNVMMETKLWRFSNED
jgi:hypothetical protein